MMKNEEIKTVINGLNFLKEKLYNGIYADRLDCIDYAVSVLNEIQQYREIGTVEDIKQAIGVLRLSENYILEIFHELNEYRKIGTVEECRKVIEGQKRCCDSVEKYADGTCIGYGKSDMDDEPLEMCKQCKSHICFEESEEE